MRRLGIDIETYSSTDLTKSGVYRYAESPDFVVLLIGYAFDDEDVRVIDLAQGEEMPDELVRGIFDPGTVKVAFNANFERVCLAKHFGCQMPPGQWRCTMVKAMELGLPRSLADVGVALGLEEEKLKDPKGKRLIEYFSKPCKPTKTNGGRTRNLPEHAPDKWQEYIEYNRQDVVAEREIWSKLTRYPFRSDEWQLWALDQYINDAGVRLDMPMVDKIVAYDDERQQELMTEAQKLTGIANPNSLAQLKPWLASVGCRMSSITKDTVAKALADPKTSDLARQALTLRQAMSKTSVKKYKTMQTAVCADDRLRGMFQFAGARSRRWTGKLVQPQNLARNTLPDLDYARQLTRDGEFEELHTMFGETSFIFSELVRTAFIPSDGCRFVVSDFAQIEARVISWISGENWRLDVFTSGRDIYCEAASRAYGVPVEKHGANAHLRSRGKTMELALGFGGGYKSILAFDETIPDDDAQRMVDLWRRANPRIVRLWSACERAAKQAIEDSQKHSVLGKITFAHVGGNLVIKLPSGGIVTYWNARVEDGAIVFSGSNQLTHKWGDVQTYGGKIVENIVQATARDCLATAMRRVSDLGYRVVMHIHDEMVIDVPEADTDAPRRITQIMSRPMDWASGLPLKGDTYETYFYKKD